MAEEGVRFGEFILLRRLGAGGMAEVFLARREGPEGFQKQLVVKRLLPHLAGSERFTELLLREARFAALIDHPNFVHVSSFGVIDDSYYLAMEYVDGLTIKAFLARAGALSPWVAARITIDLLDALHAIHTARYLDGRELHLVHRDVTPGNVMITGSGTVKVLDLGIAVPVNETSPLRAGTRRFMSPEQARGEALDARSDLYCVGLLLCWMLSERHPFVDDGLEAVTSRVPAALRDVIEELLQEDRDDRPASARDVQARLEDFAATRGREGSRAFLSELAAEVIASSTPSRPRVEATVSVLYSSLEPSSGYPASEQDAKALGKPAVEATVIGPAPTGIQLDDALPAESSIHGDDSLVDAAWLRSDVKVPPSVRIEPHEDGDHRRPVDAESPASMQPRRPVEETDPFEVGTLTPVVELAPEGFLEGAVAVRDGTTVSCHQGDFELTRNAEKPTVEAPSTDAAAASMPDTVDFSVAQQDAVLSPDRVESEPALAPTPTDPSVSLRKLRARSEGGVGQGAGGNVQTVSDRLGEPREMPRRFDGASTEMPRRSDGASTEMPRRSDGASTEMPRRSDGASLAPQRAPPMSRSTPADARPTRLVAPSAMTSSTQSAARRTSMWSRASMRDRFWAILTVVAGALGVAQGFWARAPLLESRGVVSSDIEDVAKLHVWLREMESDPADPRVRARVHKIVRSAARTMPVGRERAAIDRLVSSSTMTPTALRLREAAELLFQSGHASRPP